MESSFSKETEEEPQSPRFVRVVAPATLEAGFTFEAAVDDTTFVVVVPEGGVKEGEEFEVPFPEEITPGGIDIPDDEEVKALLHDEHGVPKGSWRNRLFSCCDVSTQATFWMSCFCVPILYAQILTRLRLTWKGEEGSPEETAMTFNRLVIALCFILASGAIPFAVYIVGLIAMIFYLYVGVRLRRYMRQRYEIPTGPLGRIHENCDDGCCMLFCWCCSSIQMARHTHDDKVRYARPDGLSNLVVLFCSDAKPILFLTFPRSGLAPVVLLTGWSTTLLI